MKYELKKYIAALLLLLISLLIVPKEFIHSMSGHKDTSCFFHDGKYIEKPHHHCSILNFNAALYEQAFGSHKPDFRSQKNIYFVTDYSFYFSDLSNLSSLRAPPISL
jgi:hypothetical protein